LGPILHGGYRERTQLLPIILRDVDASERLRLVIFYGEVFNGLRFLRRCVEQLPIHAGSALAGVFSDASYREAASAVRTCEDKLQCTDSTFLTLLLCLHDSALQTTHVAVGLFPIDGAPINRWTQARASSFLSCLKFPTNSCLLHHRQSVSC